MVESFLLSEDEPLTPNIDGVMALICRRRAQNTKSAKNGQKLDLSILVFIYFCPAPLEEIRSNLLIPELRNRLWDKKIRYTGKHEKGMKINPPIWYMPFPHTNPLCCTLGQEFDFIFWS